jgi:hypothetical protein
MLKHTALSFAFGAAILSSTLASVIPCAATNSHKVEAKTQEITKLNIDTANPETLAGKTTKQRIVSGLGHTVLFLPSALIATLVSYGTSRAQFFHEPFTYSSIFIASFYGTYVGATGIYNAIKNNPEIPESSSSKIDVAKDMVLGAAALVVLHDFYKHSNKNLLDTMVTIPALYSLHKSFKTIYKAIQQHQKDQETTC